MTSAPSGPSLRYGSNTPSESPRPRTSTLANAYPPRAKTAARLACGSPDFPYGVRMTITGAGRAAGSTRSADSVLPSRSGTRTLNRRISSGSATPGYYVGAPGRGGEGCRGS